MGRVPLFSHCLCIGGLFDLIDIEHDLHYKRRLLGN
jgi:hypothetical protein